VQQVREQQVLLLQLIPLHREDYRSPKQIFQPVLTLPHQQQMRLLEIQSLISHLRSSIPKLQFHRNWQKEGVTRCE
jgi:hypothetical protein